MRRLWLALPAFLGAACIAAAIAIPLFLVPQLRVVPLDLDITSEATTVAEDGSTGERFPARVFDRCSVSEPRAQVDDAHLSQQRRSVIIEPSDRRQATLQSAQTVQIDRLRNADGDETEPTMAAADAARECDDGLLTANIDRVSVNRTTSVPNGTVSSLQLEAAPEGVNPQDVSVELPDRQGFQYKFGFDVQKRSYLYYDTNTRQDIPVEFVGETTIDGVTVYEFSGEVPETDVSSLPNAQGQAALGTILTMPASWWGISGPGVEPEDSVTMHRYATATRSVWVEPETGTIIDGMEDQHQYFRSPDQSEDTPAPIRDFQMDVLKGRFKWTDETVSNQAARADDYMGQLRLGNFWLPLILGIVGVVLLGVWALLFWRGRRSDDDDTTPPTDDAETTSRLGESRVEQSPTAPADDAAGGGGVAGAAGAAGAAGVAGAGAADRRVGGAHAADPWDQPTEQIPRVETAPESETETTSEPSADETQRYRRPPSE
ncbi:DUF3068 domain-containing protein [Gordonia sp. HNM0687]|uniref:DUF3068 domain-containing protein n=1 Tax=Gordonia mangrovi TaxID=2665643 RepID=A0A6L7GQI1_9ACTN|nr:DUF3068 domain-containing protein [Gordonia mangrovi]MXP21833.1 DUF3068 domain-containing protein [Gordonia mangrovi]UVF76204.1 DUF3068 domain-containing protein [Gordonia mangrovi]